MSLGFGLVSCQLAPGDPRSWEQLYAEALDLCRLVEERGYASVWTTEHHFVDDGYMPSLLPMSAAIAARTSRLEIGTGVVLAPLYQPLRLAEDAATVQILSQGRFVLGLGLGWSQVEFEALGADIRQRGRAMEEILTLLPKAFSGEAVVHHGKVYDFPEVRIRPVATTPIPVVVGGSADVAVHRAGRLADGFFSNAPPGRLAGQVEAGLRGLEEAGRDPAGFRWIYYAVMYPADSEEEAWGAVREHAWAQRWKYSDMEASATRPGPPPAPPPPRHEDRLRAGLFLGPGDQIAERLGELRSSVGVPVEFVARSYFPAMSATQQGELVERLAAEVMPHLV